MKFLIDTHTFLWAILKNSSLSSPAKKILLDTDNKIFVSLASAWEMSIKYYTGKLPFAEKAITQFEDCLKQAQFLPLAINSRHAILAGSLPQFHKDPFDRMLIAQAKIENIPIITNDKIFENYGISILW